MSDSLNEDQKERIRILAKWVVEQAALGRTKDSIANDLRARGLSQEAASALVNVALTSGYGKPSRLASLFSTLVGWAVILVAFAALNGVLYLAQEWYHAAEVKQCEEIKEHLDRMKAEINSIEQRVAQRERDRRQIEDLEKQLQARGAYGAREAYRSSVSRYNDMVDRYNAQVEATKEIASRYKGLIDEYNADVDRYNTLAKTAYSRWYLIPIPGGRSRSLGKHVGPE